MAEKKGAAAKTAKETESKQPNNVIKTEFPEYKGIPLVRSGRTIYYGNMRDPYVIMMQVLSSSDTNGLSVSQRISIQLVKTDPSVPLTEKIVKKAERQGMNQALEISYVWLHRALSDPESMKKS
jgi:hypothetical protein